MLILTLPVVTTGTTEFATLTINDSDDLEAGMTKENDINNIRA
jgi:hypothetical protein